MEEIARAIVFKIPESKTKEKLCIGQLISEENGNNHIHNQTHDGDALEFEE